MDSIRVWVAVDPVGSFICSDDDWDRCWEKVFERCLGQTKTPKSYERRGYSVSPYTLTPVKDETE